MHISIWIIVIFPSYKLYKIGRSSAICCSRTACSKCAMIRSQQQYCCFGFFYTNCKLTCVHLCYIFWSGSSYAKNLPKFNGKEITVLPPSAALSSFLSNFERILANCRQSYINCLAILI